MTTAPTAYDVVAYPGEPYPQTHPDRLATLATLYGLTPAPPGRCRVLELGCGDAGNLVPMAYTLTESEFLGIDLASAALEKGREIIAALGLSNISLMAADLSAISDLGTFDYVIAHGVYSWVPPAVQERLLSLTREVLAAHGVAYVSYNAYPGRHVREALRQMMLWHVRGREAPAERIEEARGLIRLLAEGASGHPVVSAIVTQALKEQERERDAGLFHDDLAEINESLLFSEFVRRAEISGLKFLSEADYSDMVVWNLRNPATRFLSGLGKDPLVQQQYRDFFVFRSLRQTLLCRAETCPLSEPEAGALRGLFAASSTRPRSAEASLAPREPVAFSTERGGELTTSHPLTKAAFLVLGEEWPRWIAVPELLVRGRERIAEAGGPSPDDEDERSLFRFLLQGCGAEAVQLRSHPCPFVTAPTERPRASALARLQASRGDAVTNLRHETVRLDDAVVRELLSLLDGTRDRTATENELALFRREAAKPGDDPLPAALPAGIDSFLERIAKLALLEA